MSKYDTIFPVMIIDDDSRYVEPQKDLAYNEFGLELIHYKYWDEAQAELSDNFDGYDAVIVDGKGQLSRDSKAEDPAHLNKVINWLKQEKGKGQIIPIFINTGFHDELAQYFNVDEDIRGIFRKGENQTLELFQSVRDVIEGKANRKLEIMYPDVFSIFNDGYLPSEKRKLLIYAFEAAQNKICMKSDFNVVRELLELVYIKLKEIGILDSKYFPNGRPNLEWCYRFLCNMDVTTPKWRDSPIGYSTFPDHVGYIVNGIKNVSSAFSHSYNEEYSSYALKNITFGMMEVLLWLKKFIDIQK